MRHKYEVRGPMQNIHLSSTGISLAKDFMETIPSAILAQITHDARSNDLLDYLQSTLQKTAQEEEPSHHGPSMG
jgi:hypothetical protein